MKYLFLLPVLLKFSIAKAQTQQQEISIKAEIVGRGKYSATENSPEGYFVRLVVINNLSTTKVFWVYKCSWSSLWFVDRPNTFLYYPGCDSNYPVDIRLSPRQEVVFYGFLVEAVENKNSRITYAIPKPAAQEVGSVEEIKFAFAEITDEKQMDFRDTKELLQKGLVKMHWSNSIPIKFYNSSYRVVKPVK